MSTETTGTDKASGSTEVDACRTAAEWWAQQIGAPVFQLTGNRPGERDFESIFAEMGLGSIADRNPVTEEAARNFAGLLESAIASELAAEAVRHAEFAARYPDKPASSPSVGLFTDYHPDKILADAAEVAGVSLTRFPVKTGMRVYADHVIASLGYGSPYRLVWSAAGWARPPCGTWRMDGSDVHPALEVCSLPSYHDEPHAQWIPDPVRCARCGQPETAHYTDRAWSEDRCRFQDSRG